MSDSDRGATASELTVPRPLSIRLGPILELGHVERVRRAENSPLRPAEQSLTLKRHVVRNYVLSLVGREIDFVALRQALAKGAPWTEELVESLMPKGPKGPKGNDG